MPFIIRESCELLINTSSHLTVFYGVSPILFGAPNPDRHYIWISVQAIFTKRPFHHFTLLNIVFKKWYTPYSILPCKQSPNKVRGGEQKQLARFRMQSWSAFWCLRAWLHSWITDFVYSWAKCRVCLHLMNLRMQSKRQIWYVWKY